jgi:DNA (cytosine-5)-methyltransferase 1
MVSKIREHGGSWKDLRGTDDEELIRDCHQDLEGGAASAYGVMEWDEPAPTLTTRCTNISSGRFTHPSQDRAITFREAALLMGFPRWFELPSINSDAERVVGNAVPPRLVKEVSYMIKQESELLRSTP